MIRVSETKEHLHGSDFLSLSYPIKPETSPMLSRGCISLSTADITRRHQAVTQLVLGK